MAARARGHAPARPTSPFFNGVDASGPDGGRGLAHEDAESIGGGWGVGIAGRGAQQGKPRAVHDQLGAACGSQGRERSVTPGHGTLHVSQLQGSLPHSSGRGDEPPQRAANRTAATAAGAVAGRVSRGSPRGGHEYRTWLSVLGDEQLRAIRATLQRASEDVSSPTDGLILPSHQLLQFDSPTGAANSGNWMPESSSPMMLAGRELLPSPIHLAATVFPAAQHRNQQGQQRQDLGHYPPALSTNVEQPSAPGAIPGARGNVWRGGGGTGPEGDALKNLANCVTAQEDIRAMLEAGKRDGEMALLSRSEELNRQMEAALALQKTLLSSVESMTEETLDLRSRLNDVEVSCSQLEQERDWLRQRLNHIQLAGARLVVNGLEHVSMRTKVWALQRWYQTTRSERRERNNFAHLKKIALSRLMAGRPYQRALLAWRELAHVKCAVVNSFSASHRARSRIVLVRTCYSEWRASVRAKKAMERKIRFRTTIHVFKMWVTRHMKRKVKRQAEAVSMRRAVVKLMNRMLKGMFQQWAQDTKNSRGSHHQASLVLQRSGLASINEMASKSAVQKLYYTEWRRRYEHKKRIACIAKRATLKMNGKLMRTVCGRWAEYYMWEVAVRQAIFNHGLKRRDRLSHQRSLVQSFRLWLAVTEDVVIEREIASLRLREEDLMLQQEEQHETHLLVVCVVCMRFMRFRFKLRAFRAWIKTALPWRVFTSVRRVRTVWPGREGDSSKAPWIPAGARESAASPPFRATSPTPRLGSANTRPRSASAASSSPVRRVKSDSPSWIPPYGAGRRRSGSRDRGASRTGQKLRHSSPSPTARQEARLLQRATSQPDRAWMRGS